MKFVVETERKIPVAWEFDVIVAGGGVAGVTAALGASRNGAKVLLIERYGHLGGMASGGLVLALLGYDRYEFGINREIGEALLEKNAGVLRTYEGPRIWIDGMGLSSTKDIRYDGEEMKYLLNRMVLDENIKILFHSFIAKVVVEEKDVKGVILEGKSGRQAALAKVIVDATGDGDVFASAGAQFEAEEHPWGLSLCHRFGDVNIEKSMRFQMEHRDEYAVLMERLKRILGFNYHWGPSSRDGIVLSMHPHLQGFNALDVRDLTAAEIEGRDIVKKALEFLRENVLGFEKAILLETAPQLGVRATRRLVGEHTLSKEEILSEARFEDAVIGSVYDVPYGCLLPKEVENLIVAGRCVSATQEGLDELRLICPCIATGQAAGTAAALSVKNGVKPRDFDVKVLQSALQHGTFP